MGEWTFTSRSVSLVPRNKYLAIIALAAFCLCVVELVDAFELPLESSLGRVSSAGGLISMDIVNSLLNAGYGGLFVLMVLESASLPIPSEVVLPLAGYLVYLGKMNLWLAIADGTFALLIGALVDYYLALKLGRPVVYRIMNRIGISSVHLDNGERWIDSKGASAVFIARFVPGLRALISIPAGLLRMKLTIFISLTLLGSFIWSLVLIYLGYSAGPLWQRALGSLSTFATQVALVVVAVAAVLYVAYYVGLGRGKGEARQ